MALIEGGDTMAFMKRILMSDVLQLPVPERLKLVEDIWDSIAEIPEAVELNEAQRAELQQRLDDYRRNPDAGSPWPDVKARILSRG